jgi:hypothetical protein
MPQLFFPLVVGLSKEVAVNLPSFELLDAAQELTKELRVQFPSQGMMDALRLVYQQYWLDSAIAEKAFQKYLDVIKAHY